MKASSETVATLVRKRPYAQREGVKRKAKEEPRTSAEIMEQAKAEAIANSTGNISEKTPRQRQIEAGTANLKPFQPGTSGNPAGVPKSTLELKKYIRVHTIEIADALLEIVKDPGASSSARVQAASVLLDRAHGKSVQPIEHGNPGDFSGLTEADMLAYLAEKLPLLNLPRPVIDITPGKKGR